MQNKINKNNESKNIIKITNLNLADIISASSTKNSNNFQNLPFLSKNLRRMQLYMDSHD